MIVEEIKYRLKDCSNPEEDNYLLAVSGGKDSMVLLDVFFGLGVKFEVAHMNYGLREDESDLDEELVKSICEKRDIHFHCRRVDTKSFCETQGCSMQEGARILRYSWFEELLSERGLSWIVTAHHEEDNKETFIQNLKRGSGLRGLKAMKLIHERKLKPMLHLSRMSIDKYTSENKVEFREDASNNQNHYQRNLIRNKLLPMMEEELEGVGKGISSSIKNLQEDYDYMIQQLETEASEILNKVPSGDIVQGYKKVHPRLMFHILEKYGFNRQQVFDIMRSASSGKRIESKTYIVEDGHGDLFIYPRIEKGEFTLEIEVPGEYDIAGIKLSIKPCPVPKSFTKEKNVAYVDADKLVWPLMIRNFRNGDRMRPIGMNGTKKLSDYLTDEKIPVGLRSDQKLIISNKETVWLVDQLMSEKYKITSSTKNVLKFETF